MDLNCPIDIEKVHEQITLFTLNDCKKCIETKDKLNISGVQYREFDLEDCRIILIQSELKLLHVVPTIIIKKDGVYKIII